MAITVESESPLTNQTVVKVLTSKSFRQMVEDGGVGDWRGDPSRLARMEYVICTRNARGMQAPHDVPHGTAFFVGKIVGVQAAAEGRVRIAVSEYADVECDGVWRGDKNPVRYLDQKSAEHQLGVQFDELEFKPFPKELGPSSTSAADGALSGNLTIPQAKAGLAKTLGIHESQIEILIKS